MDEKTTVTCVAYDSMLFVASTETKQTEKQHKRTNKRTTMLRNVQKYIVKKITQLQIQNIHHNYTLHYRVSGSATVAWNYLQNIIGSCKLKI